MLVNIKGGFGEYTCINIDKLLYVTTGVFDENRDGFKSRATFVFDDKVAITIYFVNEHDANETVFMLEALKR